MESNERELLVCVGILSVVDVDTTTSIRTDSVIFEDIILVPNFEFPESQIIERLCQVPA